MSEKPVRSRIKCLTCNTEIESVHRHDFRTCSCGSVSIDGGQDYQRILFSGPYEVLDSPPNP